MKRITLFVLFFFVLANLEELCYGMDHSGQKKKTDSNRSSSVDRRSSSPSITSQNRDQNQQQPNSFNHKLAINPQRPLIQPDSLEATSRQQMTINRPITTNQIQINQKTSQNRETIRRNLPQNRPGNLSQNQTDNLVQINPSSPVLPEMHESYQKIVMANSSESGSSSATPILIPDDLIDVIKVGNGQKQKLKRPIADEPLEDNAHAKGKQKLEHFWEEAAQNEEIESLKLKKTFLNNMWTFVMTMFDILDIHLMPIDQTLLHIQHDGTFAKSKKLTLALKQLNPDEILDSICTKLVENITNRNGILKELFEKINLQAQMVFGQLIFRINKNEPVKCERIKDESEKIENKRLKVLYFYLRLLRNLAGLLESPYNGNFPKNNTNVSQSMRKCILSWISTAMGQFFEEFKAVVNGPNITEQQRKIIVMRNFGQLEVAKEVLSMLMFSLGQTLSPLVEGQKHLFNFQSPLFTVLLEDISKNNIACLLMARKEPVDFMQIAQKSAYVTSRYGVAATFLPLLFDSMEPHKDDENSHFTIIKNANVYLKLCKSLLNELENPVFSEEIIKVSANHRSKWDLIKNFLSQSVEQFNQLINQWKKEKEYINFENESEKGFVSDYLLANCIQFILNRTNQS